MPLAGLQLQGHNHAKYKLDPFNASVDIDFKTQHVNKKKKKKKKLSNKISKSVTLTVTEGAGEDAV